MSKTLFYNIREQLDTLDSDYGISLDGDDRILNVLDTLKVIEREQSSKPHKPLFADAIAQHPGLKEELAEMDKTPPPNCRQRLAREGKLHPRSSCAVCGSLSPKWQSCNLALACNIKRLRY